MLSALYSLFIVETNHNRPVLSLPVELIREIFTYARDAEAVEYRDTPNTHRFNLIPLTLSQVCQWWRNVAQSFPELW